MNTKKKILSLILTLALVLGIMPLLGGTAFANTPDANTNVGDIVRFGNFDWRVLDVQDGKALILTEQVIEDRPYNVGSEVDITWAESNLRRYLSEEFYNKFTATERALIAETQLTTADNPRFGTKGGNPTTDRIFLLSLEEVVQYMGSGQIPAGTNNSISDQYNSERIAHLGEGASNFAGNGAAPWWWRLRSPGNMQVRTMEVMYDGTISLVGRPANIIGPGIRPAMWINLGASTTPPVPPPTQPPAGGVSVILDGRALSFEVQPQIMNGRTMVPLRAIFEEMGATIEWDGATRTVTAEKDDIVVVLTIGDTSPTVNGQVVPLDQSGVIVDGRTLAPLRFVAEAFGGSVEWDANTRTASITTE